MNKNEQNSLPLAGALDGFSAGEPAYFCIPGHRFSRGVSGELTKRFGDKVFGYDVTETFGLDDLHNAKGVIKRAQELAADLYNAKHTRFLVNGSTCGNEALVLAAAGEGEELIIARNSHRSVTAGLILSGAKPVWVMPEYDEKWEICSEPSVKEVQKALEAHPKAKGVFIVSPTYYGECADIKGIADVCHKHGIPLFVDEAHGAHLYFSESFPKGALHLGADAVVMSTHKTLASLGQSSMLHVNSELVDIEKVDRALKLVMSTSPSYVLMTSLDAARHQMAIAGRSIMERTFEKAMKLRRLISDIEGIEIMHGCDADHIMRRRTDPSRIVFSARNIGVSGYELSDILFEAFGCALEMADAENAVAVVTDGNTGDDIRRLAEALRSIAEERVKCTESSAGGRRVCLTGIPETALTPRKAYFSSAEDTPLNECCGLVCAQTISPYPPGIPIIVPGEIITGEIHRYLVYCRDSEIKVHTDGCSDLNMIKTLK